MALATVKKRVLLPGTFVSSCHICAFISINNNYWRNLILFHYSHCAPTVQMALESLFLLKSRLFER